MERWEIIAGVLAVLAGAWEQVRGLWHWISKLVVIRCRLGDEAAKALVSYLAQGRGKLADECYYDVSQRWVRKLKRTAPVIFEWFYQAAGTTLWYKHRPLVISKVKNEIDDVIYVMTTFRGVDVEKLLLEATDWAEEHAQRRVGYAVYRHYGSIGRDPHSPSSGHVTDTDAAGRRVLRYTEEDLSGTGQGTQTLVLMPEARELVEDVKRFAARRAWYVERNLNWRRGWLVHGEPGTGKTTLVRELADDLDMPVHVMDLASMTSEELDREWSKSVGGAPCVILIEDIDRVFDLDQPVKLTEGGLTFDALLNVIDGVEKRSGTLLFITANHPDRVDPALQRAGRLDRIVELPALDRERRVALARMIVGEDRAEELADSCDDVPASTFVETCLRAAEAEAE